MGRIITELLAVKSIVTIALIAVLCIQTVRGAELSNEFVMMTGIIVMYYFCDTIQRRKNRRIPEVKNKMATTFEQQKSKLHWKCEKCLVLLYTGGVHPLSMGFRFCPFCGEKIEMG